jgi:transposase
MGTTECSGCHARDAQLAAQAAQLAVLEAKVRELEARLNTNSSNSSIPPSANPLGARQPVVKRKSKRKPGGQPGHRPHLKKMLPPERVDHTHPLVPQACEHCHAPLAAEASPQDPEPTRFQVIDLPPVVAVVTEYQGHFRTCADCGHVTHEPIPAEHLAHSVGPRLTATLSYFTGCHGVSKRGVEEIAEAVFDAPLALGTVSHLEQEVSAALEAPHAEAVEAVRAAPVKGADETSWKRVGVKCWLWAAATATVATFVIHSKRSVLGLTALLGMEIQGILSSDRWGPYNRVPVERRQICWAHLKRDFQKIVDRAGPSVEVGKAGGKLTKRVFAAWRAFQEGRATRDKLKQRLAPVMRELKGVLEEGTRDADATVAEFCRNILALEPALWTFVSTEGVEPTNHFLERLLRRAVLWRRRSFGSRSEAGCRFVERILTVVQTRRLQGKPVLEYLEAAVVAHRMRHSCPKLVD